MESLLDALWSPAVGKWMRTRRHPGGCLYGGTVLCGQQGSASVPWPYPGQQQSSLEAMRVLCSVSYSKLASTTGESVLDIHSPLSWSLDSRRGERYKKIEDPFGYCGCCNETRREELDCLWQVVRKPLSIAATTELKNIKI